MKKALLVMALASTASYTAWRWTPTDVPVADEDDELALNRLWIDHLPRNDRDEIQVFAAITDEPLGIFQKASQWRTSFEVFRHETHAGEIRIVYPQTGDREKVKLKARACSERGMDYCLEVKGASRGVKRYYSLEGWDIGAARTVDELARRAEAIVDGLN